MEPADSCCCRHCVEGLDKHRTSLSLGKSSPIPPQEASQKEASAKDAARFSAEA